MKVYSSGFYVQNDNNPHPQKAHGYESIDKAKEAYEEFANDCENFGMNPKEMWLYEGIPDGDEEVYGYPDYPDYTIDKDRHGVVVCKKIN